MKVAIAHDWLTGMRGGEKCLEVFCELFPEATIFTLLHNKGSVSPAIEKMRIETSFIQSLPGAATKYRDYLPLFPRAIESFDLRGFDLVLSSSHCAAKGVKVPEGPTHICYCYTPMRYAWVFFNEYFGNLNPVKRKIVSIIIERLKRWDLRTNENVDFFIAISDNVRNRIKSFYNREADVIYPPVETDRFGLSTEEGVFYLIVSALVPYKRIDIAVKAFNILGKKLVIIGTGNSEAELRKMAGPSIEFLGWVDNDKIAEYYSRASAIIFPGEEDFGIVPVEAQACGRPVIAYARGGVLETVTPINPQPRTSDERPPCAKASEGRPAKSDEPGGVFFYQQTPQALIDAVEYFESVKDSFNPQGLRKNALRFDRGVFKEKIREYLEERIKVGIASSPSLCSGSSQ